MTKKVANIAKNTSYYTIALILQKVISLTYFTLIARALSPDELGKYYFAISFTGIFGIFIDIGLTNVLTREVARPSLEEKDDKVSVASRYLSAVLTIKLPLSLLSLLLVYMMVHLNSYSDVTVKLIYLSSICMILDSFTTTLFAVARGFHNLIYESISSILFQLVVLVTGLLVLRSGLGLTWLMIALVAASTFNILYSSILVAMKMGIKMRLTADKKLIRTFINISIPFALFGMFQRLYTYIDSVMLSQMVGDYYNGIYQIAFKIVFALQFLPAAFAASIYPAFSEYWLTNKSQMMITFERALNYLIAISLPITIGTIAIADKIVLIFKSQYMEAVLPLQIAISSILFMFLYFPIGSLLNASDHQKKNTEYIFYMLASCFILNLFLIPKYKATGACISDLSTNFLGFALGISFIPKIITWNPWPIVRFFLKSLFSAFVMGVIVYLLKSHANIIISITCGAIIYFSLLLAVKALTIKDIMSIASSFKSSKI